MRAGCVRGEIADVGGFGWGLEIMGRHLDVGLTLGVPRSSDARNGWPVWVQDIMDLGWDDRV